MDKFIFVGCKGWAHGINDRGGMQFLLKAFCEEFKKENDVELLCKINVAYNHPTWQLPLELQKLGLSPEDCKNIKFIVNNIDYNELPQFYQQGDVFVSPTMGDSFNLPCIEAMSCGLPVITTKFGGQTDYVNEKNGWLVDYELVDITWDISYEGNKWAMPKIEHLRSLMRYAYEHREECKNKGNEALNTAKQLTWEASAKKLLNVIND